jgi:SsrA-binding protein
MAKTASSDNNTVCRNRKATHRFEIVAKLECGLALVGTEVKSIREKQVSLDEAYARIENGELWLVGAHIGMYRHGHTTSHEPLRRRKLLVHRQELRKLKPKVEQKGLTLVPLRIYFNERGLAKLTLALARGKRQADKRESLRARDQKREMDRAMRRR